MYAVIEKSLGGLTLPYYLRHLCFALIFPLMLFAQVNHQPGSGGMFLLAVVNTLLYPYARFLYERVWGFIMGGYQVHAGRSLGVAGEARHHDGVLVLSRFPGAHQPCIPLLSARTNSATVTSCVQEPEEGLNNASKKIAASSCRRVDVLLHEIRCRRRVVSV